MPITVTNHNAKEVLQSLYSAMLDAADPRQVLPKNLPQIPSGRTIVVGVGKAAAAMAEAVEKEWQCAQSGKLSGVIVVPEGATRPLRLIEQLIGSHPVPDEGSVRGGQALLEAVKGLAADDVVIALISGGGSALCAMPELGLTLEDKQSITRELLKRGASISEINTVRRHLSGIKGGRLAAAAYPAQVITLLISDIPGDDPALIASGPTLADSSTCLDALGVLERYGITHLPFVLETLRSGQWESVKPGDKRLERNQHTVVASAWDGLQAAREKAADLGLAAHILSDAMEGEARDLAKAHAAMALSIARRQVPFTTPCVLLSGGEATVTVRGSGKGGRNTEFALALALALEGQPGADRIYAISAGTDGLDGQAEAAGAFVTPASIPNGTQGGLSALQSLDTNDSATFLKASDDLVHTGPTFTNINDFRAVLVL